MYNLYQDVRQSKTEFMPVLQKYDTGDDVKILQEKLKVLDLFPGSITGTFGTTTEDAVKEFQASNNLPVTGIVDMNTWTALYDKTLSTFPTGRAINPTIRLGDTGEYVTLLQTSLTELLYFTGSIDGVFGSSTENAVKQFQANNNLTTDGVVGVDTWSALNYLYSPLAICGGEEETNNTYTVQAGDTLWSIARKYNLTVNQLKDLNNLTNNTISIGQVLIISNGGNEETPSNTETYIVKPGDTLYSIAKTNNTTVDNLISLNNLTSNVLNIGQTLLVPTSSSNGTTYTVKQGDTLWGISNKYAVTVNELINYNNLSSTVLSVGQVLQIPETTPPNYTTYTIKPGDTLYSVARTYNTTVNNIMSLNNLTSTVLTVGNTLKIPI